jgi:hypothetical protein
MTNKTTREYRTATTGTIDSFEREDGTRTDSYELTAEDWIPISPGWLSFGEFLARKKKRKADAKAKADAESEGRLMQKLNALSDKLELYVARSQNARRQRQLRAENDEAQRARTSKAFRERVLAIHEQKRGN